MYDNIDNTLVIVFLNDYFVVITVLTINYTHIGTVSCDVKYLCLQLSG